MLEGKRIVITRAVDQAGPIHSALKSLGADAICFPVLSIEPVKDWTLCDKAIKSIASHEALIFTSVNAVRHFLDRVAKNAGPVMTTLAGKKCYAVGQETSKALEEFGVEATTFDDASNSEQLMECIRQTSEAQSFLFPHGSLTDPSAADALVLEGRTVDTVTVYENIPIKPEQAGDMVDQLKNKKVDMVTFFSPSAVHSLLTIAGVDLLAEVPCAVIGSTTAKAAKQAGLKIILQAAFPSTDSLLNAILNYFRKPDPAGV